jgi:hypothetical protein
MISYYSWASLNKKETNNHFKTFSNSSARVIQAPDPVFQFLDFCCWTAESAVSLSFGAGLPDGLFSNQKIQIWVNFRGPLNGKCLYSLWPFGIFCSDLGYFMTIWYNLYSFGTFFTVLVSCTKKNLATQLLSVQVSRQKRIV